MGEDTDILFCGETGEKALEGSQASPVRPSDKGMKMKSLEWLDVVS
jgi:hypothetical protein